MKPREEGFKELLVSEHMEMWGAVCLERAWELCIPSHTSCPLHLPHLYVLELYPFIMNL